MSNSLSDPKPAPGWPTDDLDDYWKKYAARGGIASALPGVGFCAKDAAEFQEYRQIVDSHCPPKEKEPVYDPDLWE